MAVVTKRRSGGSRTKLIPFSARRKHNARRKASGLEKSIYSMLREDGIPFSREKLIGRCHVDVFIAPRTIVEAQGCFWHKHDCQEPKGGWPPMDLLIQAQDKARFAFFKAEGYKLVVIWECELEEDPERIRALLRRLQG